MARKSVYTKEMILDAAIQIFKRDGSDAITAKNIAKELNCSIAPIYSTYLNLDSIKKDLFLRIEECLLERKLQDKENTERLEMESLLSRMFKKLNLNENDKEFSNQILNFKNSLMKNENRENIFYSFSNLIALFSKSKISSLSRSQILTLIAKHKKYITELRKK